MSLDVNDPYLKMFAERTPLLDEPSQESKTRSRRCVRGILWLAIASTLLLFVAGVEMMSRGAAPRETVDKLSPAKRVLVNNPLIGKLITLTLSPILCILWSQGTCWMYLLCCRQRIYLGKATRTGEVSVHYVAFLYLSPYQKHVL